MEDNTTRKSTFKSNITTISEEEENYARMSLLLSGITLRAVRALFDSEFDPACLKASLRKANTTLNDLKTKRVINQSQWNLLFPRFGVPNSKTFDVTLMITLLVNLTELDHYDQLPLVTDTSLSADLGRIKYYRNHISHNKDGKISNLSFSSAWNDITEAVGRVGGQTMLTECIELRTTALDTSTVPWNIRVQIRQTLDAWRINNSNYVETRAANYVFACLQKSDCVTITASSGVGKTATLRHVALKMEDEDYDILVITNAHDIINYYNPNKKTVFCVDDFCGTYSICKFDRRCWESVEKQIKVLLNNKLTKIIVACRLQVYQDEEFKSLSIFRKCVCNLQSDDLCLLQTEKQSIAELYLETEASKIIQYCNLYACFPLLCKLYKENPEHSITDFFTNPFSVYEGEIDNLHIKRHLEKYCVLALFVVFNNRLEEKWLTDEIDKERRKRIKNTCEACKLDRGTSRLILLDEVRGLEHTFIIKEQDVYKTLHDKIFDFLVYYFAQHMIECLIKNANSEVIEKRFLLQNKENQDQFVTVVPPKYHHMYLQRLIDDWSSGRVQSLFNNINMKVPEFRHMLLCYLNTLDISLQRRLAMTCNVNNKSTVLLDSSYLGDITLIQWCLHHGVDVNQSNYIGISPLYVSAQMGHIELIKALLDNNADINKCTYNGASPLCIACCNNHIEVVKLLLDNKADINKSNDDGLSPLYLACEHNDTEIVKILLDKEVDINKCTYEGVSPLYIACENNHKETVKILLDNNADINKSLYDGTCPLYVACKENHIEIVKLLLDSKADINDSINNRVPPLCIASQNNHLEIVKLLLDNKADINKCGGKGTSPLFLACMNNCIEIVKVLLNNKADINKCAYGKVSPLFIACQENQIELVMLLLDNKSDINKCNDEGKSPLFTACLYNHQKIVKILLDNKADINKCTDNGATALLIACLKNHKDLINLLLNSKANVDECNGNSPTPLFIACQNNNIDLVKVLLDNNANVNKCSDNEASPLYIACKQNHIEIVKVLLDNKAEINKCDDTGASPMLIACDENHIDIINLLMDNKADINKCNCNGVSPLYIACNNNHIEIAKILLINNADVNKCKDGGASPLSIACQKNHIETVKLLLDNKADINKCMDNGASPLHFGCQDKHIETVTTLLDYKADIDKGTDNGTSALFIACQNNHKEIVKVLLDNKADIDKCRNDGKSPLRIACDLKNIEIVKILLDYNAEPF